ncbi:MAG: DUF4293 domain-containing protein [Bacteroidia bacterium]|nr:DUF4293 domain-containing protein [Bacteroidia bacterium]
MIQRIQTVFLAVVVICMIVTIFLPIWENVNPQTNEKIMLNAFYLIQTRNGEVTSQSATFYIAILSSVCALMALYAIFLYNNRLRQMKVVLLNTLFLCGVLGLMVYFNYQAEEAFGNETPGDYKIGYFLPGVAIISNFFARRFIKKDEEMVRSAERMR